MAVQSAHVYDKSFTAAQDLSSSQFFILSSSADDVAAICVASSAGTVARAVGVLQNNPTSGNAANARLLGQSKVVASSSGTIAISAFVGCSTGGLAITATTGMWIIGVARSASTGGAGQLIEAELRPMLYASGATA